MSSAHLLVESSLNERKDKTRSSILSKEAEVHRSSYVIQAWVQVGIENELEIRAWTWVNFLFWTILNETELEPELSPSRSQASSFIIGPTWTTTSKNSKGRNYYNTRIP